jgi:transcriptional antiterminator RfaH
MNIVDIDAWYVVQKQVNAEAKAARNLVRQGFEIYLSRCLKHRNRGRKIDKVATPLSDVISTAKGRGA